LQTARPSVSPKTARARAVSRVASPLHLLRTSPITRRQDRHGLCSARFDRDARGGGHSQLAWGRPELSQTLGNHRARRESPSALGSRRPIEARNRNARTALRVRTVAREWQVARLDPRAGRTLFSVAAGATGISAAIVDFHCRIRAELGKGGRTLSVLAVRLIRRFVPFRFFLTRRGCALYSVGQALQFIW
jgi:hypothetical protein